MNPLQLYKTNRVPDPSSHLAQAYLTQPDIMNALLSFNFGDIKPKAKRLKRGPKKRKGLWDQITKNNIHYYQPLSKQDYLNALNIVKNDKH